MTAALGAFQLGLAPMLAATLSIGPRNAFVLRHGLARDRVFLVTAICLAWDVAVVVSATHVLGAYFAANPWLADAIAWGGVCFLLLAAGRSLRRAWLGGASLSLHQCRCPVALTVLGALGVNVLNPLAWTETIVVLGALASTVGAPWLTYFGTGAVLGSVLKFSILAAVANRLASLFIRCRVRRGFDAAARAAMLAMAVFLAAPHLAGTAGHLFAPTAHAPQPSAAPPAQCPGG